MLFRSLVARGELLFGLTDTDDAFGAVRRGAPVAVVAFSLLGFAVLPYGRHLIPVELDAALTENIERSTRLPSAGVVIDHKSFHRFCLH